MISDEVYGDSANCDTPKNEKSLMDPTNPYSASKAAQIGRAHV